MNQKQFLTGVRKRLPGHEYPCALIRAYRLVFSHPEIPLYRSLLLSQLRGYFCLRPHYGAMPVHEVSCVPPLYHVTSAANRESILASGLSNPKTGLIFLTDSLAWAKALAARRGIGDPVCFMIEAPQMLHAGCAFVQRSDYPHFWITQSVPPNFLWEISCEHPSAADK